MEPESNKEILPHHLRLGWRCSKQETMNANPATVPTLLLAFSAWFEAGENCYPRWPRLSLAFGVLLALPCALAIFYYTHLLDHAVWFFNLRTVPWIELDVFLDRVSRRCRSALE